MKLKKNNESRRSEGRPRGMNHLSYRNYKNAKNNFSLLQRHESSEFINKSYKTLENAAELDYRLFWRMLRNKKQKQKLACTEIRVNDISYSDNNIANGFSEHFKNIFAEPKESDISFDESLKLKLEQLKHSTIAKDFSCILESEFTIIELLVTIKQLKRRKSPGLDNILSEHIINDGPFLYKMIVALFSCILSKEYTPKEWKKGS